MPFLTASLLVALFVGGCAAPLELASESGVAALSVLEARLADNDVARLVPPGTDAATVRQLLGPPYRSYLNAWEYQLAGFNRPRTLVVRFSSDDVVTDAQVFERRGALRHRRLAAH